jgi:hypothetical protein
VLKKMSPALVPPLNAGQEGERQLPEGLPFADPDVADAGVAPLTPLEPIGAPSSRT